MFNINISQQYIDMIKYMDKRSKVTAQVRKPFPMLNKMQWEKCTQVHTALYHCLRGAP